MLGSFLELWRTDLQAQRLRGSKATGFQGNNIHPFINATAASMFLSQA